MRRITALSLLLIFLTCSYLFSQDFSDSYIVYDYGQEIIVNLVQESNGKVTGTMSSEGIEYDITGELEGNEINGIIEGHGEYFKFTARSRNENLQLTLFDPSVERSEYDEFAETLEFSRAGGQTVMKQSGTEPSGKTKSNDVRGSDKVVINGIVLTEEQISELENIYAVKPLPGNYWYDSQSGLYGVVGYQAYGFMLAGHDFGELDERASNGDAGVFVNGREMPQTEWLIWSQLLGYYIQSGRYWLDENGNAGYKSNPIPTENLYAAAQRNYYSGSGSGGDNIWSTRFGAGNYDQGNQSGYVSVPGYGPVGYGF
jgi:hypothetical protein